MTTSTDPLKIRFEVIGLQLDLLMKEFALLYLEVEKQNSDLMCEAPSGARNKASKLNFNELFDSITDKVNVLRREIYPSLRKKALSK